VIDHAANAGRHPHAQRGLDLYETPAEAVIALLKYERLPRLVWEPCCGPGAIVRVLQAAGHSVIASDIVDYGLPDQEVEDFLKVSERDALCLVTNPPFQHADRFVRHALKLDVPKVIMLLRWAFMESERRTSILEHAGLARIYLFRKRLPMMHRAGWKGRRATSSIPFAWYVWRRGYTDWPQVRRISWTPIEVSDGGQRNDHQKTHLSGIQDHARVSGR
jgi:hypothetical protein